MKVLVLMVSLILVYLQYTLWFGPSGHFAQERLRAQLAQYEAKVEVLEQGNLMLTAEVRALKRGNSALEARAREDLGLIKSDEVFYLTPEGQR